MTYKFTYEESIHWIQNQPEHSELLPFPDSTFDIIYVRQALHHFSSLQKGLAECSRVLKPKGLLLATREHFTDNEKELKAFLESDILHKLHGGENAYPLKVYTSSLENSGFIILSCFSPFATVINHFPTSNTELMDYLFQPLKKILGRRIASAIINLPYLEIIYRYLLSHFYKYPDIGLLIDF